MDHFGIGHGLRGAARIYSQSGRRTGRTTSLVESLKDGDRVICAEPREAERLRRLFRERSLQVECIVVNPTRAREAADLPRSLGRTLFDHSWVELFYTSVIEQGVQDIDHLQQTLSAKSHDVQETARFAEEFSRWR